MKAKFEDITGVSYNSLTAVRLDRWQPRHGFYWFWECVCGKQKSIRMCHVLSGHVKSCGCRRADIRKKTPPLCKKCGETSTRKTAKGGYSVTCSKCYIVTQNHKAKPVDYIFYRAQTRAKQADVPFEITKEDIVISDRCPVLGTKMQLSRGIAGRNDSPSLDRINPALGYVPGNVAVISYRANRIKNNGSAAEHRLIADWMDAQKEKQLVDI